MEPYPDQLRPSVAEYQTKAAAQAAAEPIVGAFAPHELRVIEERDALKDKIIKLEKFLHAPMAGTLGLDEQMRLRFQYLFMSQYHMVLCERINAFSTPQAA